MQGTIPTQSNFNQKLDELTETNALQTNNQHLTIPNYEQFNEV